MGIPGFHGLGKKDLMDSVKSTFCLKQAKEVNFDPYTERSILGLEIYGLDQIKDKLL